MASAAASPPVMTRAGMTLALIGHHPDRAGGTDDRAELAPLAEALVEAGEGRPVQPDGRVGAIQPAEEAVDTRREIGLGLEPGPPTPGSRLDGLVGADDPGYRKVPPGGQLRH